MRRAAGAALALVFALVVVGSVAAATRGDRTPPTMPTNLRVTSVSHTSVTLAWDPSTDKSGFSYSVNVNGLSWSVPQTQTTYTITSLSPGRTTHLGDDRRRDRRNDHGPALIAGGR